MTAPLHPHTRLDLTERLRSIGVVAQRFAPFLRARLNAHLVAPNGVGDWPGPCGYALIFMTSMSIALGSQYSRDDAFTARMRLHQSWYRCAVLQVPFDRHGNMLVVDDGERGLNFLSHDIARLAVERQRQLPSGIERDRLMRNMLSSQPMCFNLFGPLALDRELGPCLVAALLGDRDDIALVHRVQFEYAPSPATDFLGDRTAFDVWIEAERRDGTPVRIGIETKLTEPFSLRHYALDERPLYRRWVNRPNAPWRVEMRGSLDAIAHNQLWRDHMLAFAVSERLGSCIFILVRHSLDTKCEGAMRSYEACLRDDVACRESFLDRPLDDIVRRWRPILRGTRFEAWLNTFERRYVDMTESLAFWQGVQAEKERAR